MEAAVLWELFVKNCLLVLMKVTYNRDTNIINYVVIEVTLSRFLEVQRVEE